VAAPVAGAANLELLTPNFCVGREDFGCARRRAAQFSPALGAARARGISGDGKCGRGGGRTRAGVSCLCCELGGVVPAASAAGKLAEPRTPRSRYAERGAGIVLRAFARIRARAGVPSRWVAGEARAVILRRPPRISLATLVQRVACPERSRRGSL
jgi:hypothetical protein